MSLPGSTCNIVFTLSRNTLARFSSPLGALTLKTLVAGAELDLATLSGRGIFMPGSRDVVFLPVSMSMMSGLCVDALRTGGLGKGSATI